MIQFGSRMNVNPYRSPATAEGRSNIRPLVSRRRAFLALGLLISWTVLIIWSFASLAFYRSSAGHGPDMVGDEVFHFALPLVLALFVAIAACFAQPLFRLPKWLALVATITLAIIEVIVYSAFVVDG